MKRIIDANLNRVTEALRVLEELTRFKFNNIELSSYLKNQRHEICKIQDLYYDDLLKYRNSEQDIGINIDNPTKIVNLHKNNINLEEYNTILTNRKTMVKNIEKEVSKIDYKGAEVFKSNLTTYLNNVDKNIELISNSNMPDVENGTLILGIEITPK